MRQRSAHSAKIYLFVLMAMGNWGNTPTPPLDSSAPAPVGNDGELRLNGNGQSREYRVQSARLSAGGLVVAGEAVGGEPEFRLQLERAAEPDQEAAPNLEALRSAVFRVVGGSLEVEGEHTTLTGGLVTVTSASGSGPWEVDGKVHLEAESGASFDGAIELRVRV